MPVGKDCAGRGARPCKVDRDDRVDRMTVDCVIFAHADPALAAEIDDAIREPPLAIGRGRRRRQGSGLALAGAKPVKPAVRDIREVENVLRNRPGAAAIFVHARANVERFGRDVGRIRAGFARAHDDIAALLLRPCLQPVNDVSVETHLRQADRLANDEVGRDRRFPGSVRRRLRAGRHGCLLRADCDRHHVLD